MRISFSIADGLKPADQRNIKRNASRGDGDDGSEFSAEESSLFSTEGAESTVLSEDSSNAAQYKTCQYLPSKDWLAFEAEDSTVQIWEVMKEKKMASFQGHNDDINDMQFSTAGDLLLTASSDGSLKVRSRPSLVGHEEGGLCV